MRFSVLSPPSLPPPSTTAAFHVQPIHPPSFGAVYAQEDLHNCSSKLYVKNDANEGIKNLPKNANVFFLLDDLVQQDLSLPYTAVERCGCSCVIRSSTFKMFLKSTADRPIHGRHRSNRAKDGPGCCCSSDDNDGGRFSARLEAENCIKNLITCASLLDVRLPSEEFRSRRTLSFWRGREARC